MVRIIFRCRRVPRLRLKLTPNPSKRIITKNELRLIKLHSKLMKRQQKCIPKMKKWEKSHKFGPWANLPEDLWQKIMELMSTDDQFRSTSVCKDWHSAITRIARSLELSYRGGGALFWEFYYRWETSVGNPKLSLVSQLNDPSSGGSFDLVKSNWNCKTKFAFGANPVAQKNGWFLFAKKFQWKSYFFLYHVFSKRTIWLPALKYFFDIATFSSKALPLGPECQSDCVIFASYRSGSGIYIATYKIGDENWEIMLVATAKADDSLPSTSYRTPDLQQTPRIVDFSTSSSSSGSPPPADNRSSIFVSDLLERLTKQLTKLVTFQDNDSNTPEKKDMIQYILEGPKFLSKKRAKTFTKERSKSSTKGRLAKKQKLRK
ncbi:OLC1v1000519C1 [Oldenlandia corymbosa var. corymbosa]|uniref:OLC1v1000519C1 n=1 Tax=Oldenlandia corymbosa var. corymbosa TaxID=529605 RepID=A0AAV1D3W3_OLDCO|nr:OLC1v1000519C1 [Oldenlandia corymbosa var. corymbosa]